MNRLLHALFAAALLAAPPAGTARAGEKPDAEAAALVEQLGADDIQTRERAHKKLLEMGPRAAAAVKAGLESADAETRSRCTIILPRLAWAAAGAPPPFDSLVHPSTLLYIATPDAGAMWGRFRKGHLGSLLYHDALKPFWGALAKDMDRHEEGRVTKYIFTDIVPGARGQAMMALSHVKFDREMSLVLAAQHRDANAMLQGLDKEARGSFMNRPSQLLEGAGPFSFLEGGAGGDDENERNCVGFGTVADALVLFAAERVGTRPVAEFLRRWRDGAKGGGLAAEPAYAALRKRVPNADLFAFFDSEKLVASFTEARAGVRHEMDMIHILSAFGLTSLRAGIASMTFRDDGLVEEHQVFEFTGERKGLFGLFSFKPLDPAKSGLRLAPRDAALAATAKIGAKAIYRQVLTIANAFAGVTGDPDEKAKDLTGEWNAQIKDLLGVDADTMLGFLDGEITLVGLLDDASVIPMGVLAIESSRPAELLKVIREAAVKAGLEWKTEKAGEVDLHRLTGPMVDAGSEQFQLCAAATATHVFVASHRAAAVKVLAAGPSMAEDGEVKAALAALPSGCGMMAVGNSRRIAEWGLAQLRAHADEMGMPGELKTALAALPPAAELTKGWKPSVLGAAVGERELVWKGVGSLPLLTVDLMQALMMPMLYSVGMRGF